MLWIILSVVAIGLFYWAFVKPMKYWSDKGVTQGPIRPLFGDNLGIFLRQLSFSETVQQVYDRFPNERYTGMYQMVLPTLMLRDPDLIKQLTVKDFDHFVNHRPLLPEDADPLWSQNLFALRDQKWRDMRALLSPAFTSSKMRSMFSLINECGEQFTTFYLNKDSNKEIVLELKDAFSRYTNDVIATCAFGLKVDSLKERDNEFYNMGKDATDLSGMWKTFKVFAFAMFPTLSKIFKLSLYSTKVSNFFYTLVSDTLRIREKEHIIRPDMINLLMEAMKGRLKHSEAEEDIKDSGFATAEESHVGKADISHTTGEITDMDVSAQAMIFFFAGFETASTLMCFMAYELACNPDIQERLAKEVLETRKACGDKLTYESLSKMKYMDMVISEALRKWPPATSIDRVCVKPYTIEPVNPGEKPIPIKVGEVLWLPIKGIHYNKKYFPEPDRFDPERFNDENKKNIVPYSYIPFGSGPRNCIGSRFALMETKTIFFHIISKFEITVVEKTPIPMILAKSSFNPTAEAGFWLGLKPRKHSCF